jgi:hypothetical protein
MTATYQIENNKIDKGLWSELNEEQSAQINGGGININTNVNVNTNINVGIQTNIATVIGSNPVISQYNSYMPR